MINTYSESSLHKALKRLYSLEDDFRTEVAADGKVYDISDKDGNIIEIQTKNVSKLMVKASGVLHSGHMMKIVHPVIVEKHIKLYDENGTMISQRKSPVKESVYSIFEELTGIYPILLEKGFSLDVPEITMSELRIRTKTPVQSPNGRRRFCKNWNKTDKVLGEIIRTHTFSRPEDYLSLIPAQCLPLFSAKELEKALKADKTLPSSASRQAHLMIWVLSRMNLLEFKEIRSRSRYYALAGS